MKYDDLMEDYFFVSIAVQTCGIVGHAALSLLLDIGDCFVTGTNDHRQSQFLFQRLPLVIVVTSSQFFNCQSVLARIKLI